MIGYVGVSRKNADFEIGFSIDVGGGGKKSDSLRNGSAGRRKDRRGSKKRTALL